MTLSQGELSAEYISGEIIDLGIETDEKGRELIEKFSSDLKRIAGIDYVNFEEVIGEDLEIGKYKFKLNIEKNK